MSDLEVIKAQLDELAAFVEAKMQDVSNVLTLHHELLERLVRAAKDRGDAI